MKKLLTLVRGTKPLVHHITNYVTVNDCANITLGIGASPVMADSIHEVADIAAIASALVLNMGTLNERTIPSMLAAGQAANKKGIPVVLDPVGVGASPFRTATARELIQGVKISVLRGNISEIKSIAGMQSETKGVDAAASDAASTSDGGQIAQTLAKKLDCVVVISGAVDVIADGSKIALVENGHPMLAGITGTGCMCSSLIGSFCGAAPGEIFTATVLAMACMGVAGEIAWEKAGHLGGGSFHTALHDAISTMDDKILEGRVKCREA